MEFYVNSVGNPEEETFKTGDDEKLLDEHFRNILIEIPEKNNANESRRSSFWLEFDIGRRRRQKRSVWNRFKTPYDHLFSELSSTCSLNDNHSDHSRWNSDESVFVRSVLTEGSKNDSERDIEDEEVLLSPTMMRKSSERLAQISSQTSVIMAYESLQNVENNILASHNSHQTHLPPISPCRRFSLITDTLNNSSLYLEVFPSDLAFLPSDDRPKWTKSREEIHEEWANFFKKLESLQRGSCQRNPFTSSDSLNMIMESKNEDSCTDLCQLQPGEDLLNGYMGRFIDIKRKRYSEEAPNYQRRQIFSQTNENKNIRSLNAVFGDLVFSPLTMRKLEVESALDEKTESKVIKQEEEDGQDKIKEESNRSGFASINKSNFESNKKRYRNSDKPSCKENRSSDGSLCERSRCSDGFSLCKENRSSGGTSLCKEDRSSGGTSSCKENRSSGGTSLCKENRSSGGTSSCKESYDENLTKVEQNSSCLPCFPSKRFVCLINENSAKIKSNLCLPSIRSKMAFSLELNHSGRNLGFNFKSKETSLSVPECIYRINSGGKFSSELCQDISYENLNEIGAKNPKKVRKSLSFHGRKESEECDDFYSLIKNRQEKSTPNSVCDIASLTALSPGRSFNMVPPYATNDSRSVTPDAISDVGEKTEENHKTITKSRKNSPKSKPKSFIKILKNNFCSFQLRSLAKLKKGQYGNGETIGTEIDADLITSEKKFRTEEVSKNKNAFQLESSMQIMKNALKRSTSVREHLAPRGSLVRQHSSPASKTVNEGISIALGSDASKCNATKPKSSQGRADVEKRNIAKILPVDDTLDEESLSHSPSSDVSSIQTDSTCEDGMVGVLSSKSVSSSESSRLSKTIPGGRLGSSSYSNGGKPCSPSHQQNNTQFAFNNQGPQFSHLITSKGSPGSSHLAASEGTYPYQTYSHQTSLEDQGIDIQSPGRSSPGSGSGSSTTGSTTSGNCRNSTTSLDSGRASSSTQTHTHRLSGQSYDSGSILRHSYHSSSSSLGSVEHEGSVHVNVQELLNNGVPDSEVLRIWLSELHFEEYYEKFLSAGYDMPTISRMTPEDLNAIGITKPAHRKKLKTEISQLNISDWLPDYIPSRLEEWLTLLRLDTYTPSLMQQNYCTVEQVTQITWEDLEDVGITKLGHQKKVMLAIKRVKDIMAGKKFSSISPQTSDGKRFIYATQEGVEPNKHRELYASLSEGRHFQGYNYCHDIHSRLGIPGENGGEGGMHQGNFTSTVHPAQTRMPYTTPYLPPERMPHPAHSNTIHYRPDIVAVNIRCSGKTRNTEEPIYGTYQTFVPVQRPTGLPDLPPRPILPLQAAHPQRSLDDGDITPTNEMSYMYEGGATLPRPRTANKYRPVAMVTAKTRADVHGIPNHISKEGNVINQKCNQMEKVLSASTNNTPQGTPKKIPPPPPKRSNSVSESTQQPKKPINVQRRGLSYGYIQIKNNLEPDGTTDLPPPPPAPQDRGNHQLLPEDFPPPPPPLTCITMANAVRVTDSVVSSCSSFSEGGTTHFCSDTDAEGFRPRRNESNASFKSTSSTDSGDSLPFANDNAGTIKQRTIRPSFTIIDSRSSPRSSPMSSPALRRKEGIVLPTIRHPQPHSSPSVNVPNILNGCQTMKGINTCDEANDVLSDIGNMLANLTDELDAMLEQELTIQNKVS